MAQGPLSSGSSEPTILTTLRLVDDKFTTSDNVLRGVAVPPIDPGLSAGKSG